VTNVKTKEMPALDPARAAGDAPKPPTILLFGDSHSHAVQRAIEKRIGKGLPVPLSAHRLLKEKNGNRIGDTSFEDFLEAAGRLGPTDVVLSMIGGNQHAVFSTIQHPQPFDFIAPDESKFSETGELIPYRALEAVFAKGLRGGDGRSLEALRKSTPARVVHIIPPPPKADNDFIEKHHESWFAQDLPGRGVSPPALRLKFWKLQTRGLEGLCAELGIEVMLPPAGTVDDRGFLRPEYYAQDATHANWHYGERLLREVEERFVEPAHMANGVA
jgi:hypothetical protein